MVLIKYDPDNSSHEKEAYIEIEADNEQRIDAQFTTHNGIDVCLISSYFYDDLVMFLYAYKYIDFTRDNPDFDPHMSTNRSMLDPARLNCGLSRFYFKYKVNNQSPTEKSYHEELGSSSGWSAGVPTSNWPVLIRHNRFSYVFDLVNHRLPDKFRDTDIVFKADYLLFNKPVTEIKHIALYPPSNETKRFFLDQTFSLSIGKHDMKISYSVGGVQSYIIADELEVFDNLAGFEEAYGVKWQKNLDEHLEKRGMSKEEREARIKREVTHLHKLLAQRRLRLSYLKPEVDVVRKYGFYTPAYLDAAPNSFDTTHLSSRNPVIDARKVDGYYRCTQDIGIIHNDADMEYEIKLIWITDKMELEQGPIFEITI